jgi:uncharacterized membrane protein
MKTASLIVGILGVVLYLLCFQLKSAKKILGCRLLSNSLFVIQYLLLGAFVGAAMDTTTFVTSFFSYKKDAEFIKKHKITVVSATFAAIVIIGFLLFDNVFSLLPIAGALLENAAGWMKKEKMIRIVTLFAAPCWFAYNLISGAYGSAVGSVLSVVSIVTALVRYSKESNS